MQQAGPPNFRRHALRHLIRVTVLAVGDVAALAALGWAVLLLRDSAVLGASASRVLTALMPARFDADLDSGAALLLGLLVTGNYGQGDQRRSLRLLFIGTALGMALTVWPSLWYANAKLVLAGAAASVAGIWGVLVVERLVIERLVNLVGWSAANRSRTVFVGRPEEYRATSGGPAFREYGPRSILGFVDPVEPPAPGALGTLVDLGAILVESRAECVVVCGQLEAQDFRGIVQAAQDTGCHLLTVPRAFRVIGVEPQMVWRQGQPLIELTSPAVKGHALVLKRISDVLVSIIGLIALSPVFLVVAATIKATSRGPVFYQSPRWGRFWRPMGMWKFRSMVVEADELLERDARLRSAFEANIKLVGDPRITPAGRFLRKWSLDELPQLFNVLVGDMSLVGPRPKMLGEEGRYGAAMDTVLAVRPGLTGLWQVSGRNRTTYDERISLDVQYASHPSFWGDLEILLRTVPEVLKGTGAH